MQPSGARSGMTIAAPERVLISGGHEVGGLASFAESLRCGFAELGIPAETVTPREAMRRWGQLRSPKVLKILSTAAAFAAPIARRTICMAHGFPRADSQGWLKLSAILATHKLANASRGAQLVAVSHYSAVNLRSVFHLSVDAVIHNPVNPLFLERAAEEQGERRYITYVGRLVPEKNVHRLLPPLRELLDENPEFRVCLVGDGPDCGRLRAIVRGDSRFEFPGTREPRYIRDQLRRTRLFFSGCETEALGLAYLEALAQGCAVAMPACGGGIEIAPEQVGRQVHLLPLSFDHQSVLAVLRRCLWGPTHAVDMSAFSARAIAEQYLKADARFDSEGWYRPDETSMPDEDRSELPPAAWPQPTADFIPAAVFAVRRAGARFWRRRRDPRGGAPIRPAKERPGCPGTSHR